MHRRTAFGAIDLFFLFEQRFAADIAHRTAFYLGRGFGILMELLIGTAMGKRKAKPVHRRTTVRTVRPFLIVEYRLTADTAKLSAFCVFFSALIIIFHS